MDDPENGRYKSLWLVALLLLALSTAGAADLKWTFESPIYSVGNLVGQDGWTNVSGSAQVSATIPVSGAQSARFPANGDWVMHSLSGQTFTNTATILKFVNRTGGGTQVVYMVGAAGTSGDRYYFQINYQPSGILVWYGDLMQHIQVANQVNPDDVYETTVTWDFPNHTFAVQIRNLTTPGQTIASGSYTLDYHITKDNCAGRLELRQVSAGSGGTWDDIEFSTGTQPAGADLTINIGNDTYLVQSRFSTPTPSWVTTSNSYFTFDREVQYLSEVIIVRDTFHNLTGGNLPLMQRHTVNVSGLQQCWIGGRTDVTGLANSQNPTTYATKSASGIGLMALDDVSRVHVANTRSGNTIGLSDNSFVLQPGATRTVEWLIVPTTTPDYFAFVNAVRRYTGVNFTIEGGLACIAFRPVSSGSMSNAQLADFARYKSAKWLISGLLYPPWNGLTNPHSQGWRDADHSYHLSELARVRAAVPGSKILCYFDTFLEELESYAANYPNDRVLDASGNPVGYFGDQNMREFLPTDTNDWGRDIVKNVDFNLDTLGYDGIYQDEFENSYVFYHYGNPWDGVSADINQASNRIDRLKTSIILASQNLRAAHIQRLLDRGAPLIGNDGPSTRTMTQYHFPRFAETNALTHCTKTHLYTPLALGDHLTEHTEVDCYKHMLKVLDYGCLYYWYDDFIRPTHITLTEYMFPITPLELHEGYIVGKERIVTNRSGLYGWGDNSARVVHAFDSNGYEVPSFTGGPTVVIDGKTYTNLTLPTGWSAAIVRTTPAPDTPGTPTDEGAFSTTGNLAFNWTAGTNGPDFAGYNVQIGDYPGGANVFNGKLGNVLTYAVTGLAEGTYYCRVQARDNLGNTSPWSGNSDGIIVESAPPSAPGTPTDAGAYISTTSVIFNWTAATDAGSGVQGYNCQIGTAPGGNDVFDGYIGNVLTYTITGEADTRYYCRVQAKDNTGNLGPWSGNSDGIMVDNRPPSAPGVPTDAGAYIKTTSVSFNWTAAVDTGVGVGGYYCQIGTTPGGGEITNGYIGNTLARTITGSHGNTYYCRVQAKDLIGNFGPWSEISDGVMVDTIVPVSGAAASPTTGNGSPITITYSGASDSGSGIKNIELWYKKESGGAWTNSGVTSVGGSGSFYFAPPDGNGTYYFDLVAEDNAGNRAAEASGSGNDSTLYTLTYYTVTGHLTLPDYPGDITQVLITVELRKHGGNTTTRTINLDTNGNYTLSNVEGGTYDFAFKASHWLRTVAHDMVVD